MNSSDFAKWFRDSTPYVSAHSGKTFVLTLGDDTIASQNFINIVHDLALLKVLGAKLVIVHGVAGSKSTVTNAAHRDAIVSSISKVRSRLEGIFSNGIPTSPLRNSRITLVSGNLVTAKPLGVIEGIDQLFAGTPQRIHVSAIRQMINTDAIVLIPPLGYSASGEAYILCPETLAAEVATAIQADKLIIYDATERMCGVSDMTPLELENMLESEVVPQMVGMRLKALLKACRQGVKRGHLISHEMDGALLQELFTAEGVGTQISEMDYRTIRPATVEDVAGIIELIRPLEEAGTLVKWPHDRLESEIEKFAVAELDGILIGCCALYRHDDSAELACLATHPSYRARVGGQTLGERVLEFAQNRAACEGIESVFVLTTNAEQWFAGQGFKNASIDELPASKKALYNYQRNSKIMIKDLSGHATKSDRPKS